MNSEASEKMTTSNGSPRAYPVLLTLSLGFSALMCWLYMTKPVIQVQPGETSPRGDVSAVKDPAVMPQERVETEPSNKSGEPELVPSAHGLPGMPSAPAKKAEAGLGQQGGPDPRKLAAGDGSGWETTNARVQHILSADTGDGALSKIVLNVPVLYQSRTMRWTPQDVQQAQDVLTRLMVYEKRLSQMKQEGQLLLRDWNQLLERTVPGDALRADSPSLPYNHTFRGRGGSAAPNSGSTIKIAP